jgi:hypothetical protein
MRIGGAGPRFAAPAGPPGVEKMLDALLRPPPSKNLNPALAGALAQAAAALARLDQALAGHPLLPAFLHRARLDAVRRQAAVDGLVIDPWHLAAVLEGFRLRMDGALRIIDRGAILAAARHALDLHQWLVAPDFDQEGAVQQAEKRLAAAAASAATPLLAAATGLHTWLGGDGQTGGDGHGGGDGSGDGGARPPIRAALVRFWVTQRLLREPVPLTGDRALRPDTPWQRDTWMPAFLSALADEAADGLDLLVALERAWRAARHAVAGRRRHSRAAAAVDLLAAAPLVSASSLAAGLGMAVKNATLLLDDFCAAGIAVEVTHRSKRRLFGLTGLAPLRDVVRPPYRPEPGRGRGRPPLVAEDAITVPALPPVPPLDRQPFDYSDLAHWMTQMDQTIRQARRALSAVAPSTRQDTDVANDPLATRLPDSPADPQ